MDPRGRPRRRGVGADEVADRQPRGGVAVARRQPVEPVARRPGRSDASVRLRSQRLGPPRQRGRGAEHRDQRGPGHQRPDGHPRLAAGLGVGAGGCLADQRLRGPGAAALPQRARAWPPRPPRRGSRSAARSRRCRGSSWRAGTATPRRAPRTAIRPPTPSPRRPSAPSSSAPSRAGPSISRRSSAVESWGDGVIGLDSTAAPIQLNGATFLRGVHRTGHRELPLLLRPDQPDRDSTRPTSRATESLPTEAHTGSAGRS